MLDPVAIFDAWLRQAGTFATYMGSVGGAVPVICPVLPEGFTNTNKAVVFHPEGTSHHVTGDQHRATFVCKCYGGSKLYSAARAVGAAIFDHVHNQSGKIASAVIHKFLVLDQFQGGEEPTDGWPTHIVRVEMNWSEQP